MHSRFQAVAKTFHNAVLAEMRCDVICQVSVNTMCQLGRGSTSIKTMAERTLGKTGANVTAASYIFLHYAMLSACEPLPSWCRRARAALHDLVKAGAESSAATCRTLCKLECPLLLGAADRENDEPILLNVVTQEQRFKEILQHERTRHAVCLRACLVIHTFLQTIPDLPSWLAQACHVALR